MGVKVGQKTWGHEMASALGGSKLMQIDGNCKFEGFPLQKCSVWVCNIMTPEKLP